ncbi:hypothetical protein ACT691_13010 [Vibrio metschnikovii]
MQLRLPRRNGKRAFRLLELNKFRAGFDFLEMRGEIEGGDVQKLAKWWQTFQNAGRNMRRSHGQRLRRVRIVTVRVLVDVNRPLVSANLREKQRYDHRLYCGRQ